MVQHYGRALIPQEERLQRFAYRCSHMLNHQIDCQPKGLPIAHQNDADRCRRFQRYSIFGDENWRFRSLSRSDDHLRDEEELSLLKKDGNYPSGHLRRQRKLLQKAFVH